MGGCATKLNCAVHRFVCEQFDIIIVGNLYFEKEQ